MITYYDVIATAIAPATAAAVLFVVVMLALGRINFLPNGERRNDWRKLKDELLSSQVEYHNNATYRAFEFYVKVLLAVFGGFAYISLRPSPLPEHTRSLIDAAGWLVLGVSLLFALLVTSHQRAKIERWRRRYTWLETITWNECWFVSAAAGIAFFTKLTVVPILMN
ncbi:MAG: hypothetical protein AB1578_12460 [Thermodesulfobacteriota bacterium]